MAHALTPFELSALAHSIRASLGEGDPENRGLTAIARARWEGVLAGLEIAMGQEPTRLPDAFLTGLP
jgi:hypothetical protein